MYLRICLQVLRRFFAELAKFFGVQHRPFQVAVLRQVFVEVGAYEISFCFFIARHILLQFGQKLFVVFIMPANDIGQEVQ